MVATKRLHNWPNRSAGPTAHGWWYEWVGPFFNSSYSWRASYNQTDFLWLDIPGGYPGSTYGPHVYVTGTSSGSSNGDIMYYKWGVTVNGSPDHVSIRSGYGYDPHSGWLGDWVDQHTTDRQHAYWALTPYNANWYTTTITVWHVSSSN